MGEPLLNVNDISYAYHTKSGETPALSHISFSVSRGEFTAIVGPSGCGKSTFLDMLCGLLHPEKGEILLAGKPLQEKTASIGYMLQKDHLFEWRTIYSNILLGLDPRRSCFSHDCVGRQYPELCQLHLRLFCADHYWFYC